MLSFSLKDRLLSAEDEFVTALIDGDDAVIAFNQRWESLVGEVDAAFENNTLQDDVAALVHTTATRIATLADITVDVYTSYNAFTAQLVDQIEGLMSELSLVDPLPPRTSTYVEHRPPRHAGAIGKRRRSSSPDPEDSMHAHKRHRSSNATPDAASPPPSSFESTSSTPSPASSESFAVPRVAKRRFSDTELSDIPATRKRLHVGPRHHAVSDSFVLLQTPAEKAVAKGRLAFTNMPRSSPRPPQEERLSLDTSSHLRTDPVSSIWESGLTDTSLSSDSLGSIDFCTNWEEANDPTASLAELVSLDAFLKSILDPSIPSITLPAPQPDHARAYPSVRLEDHTASEAPSHPALLESPSSQTSSLSPGSSTPSSPRNFPATPTINTDLFGFDLQSPSNLLSSDIDGVDAKGITMPMLGDTSPFSLFDVPDSLESFSFPDISCFMPSSSNDKYGVDFFGDELPEHILQLGPSYHDLGPQPFHNQTIPQLA